MAALAEKPKSAAKRALKLAARAGDTPDSGVMVGDMVWYWMVAPNQPGKLEPWPATLLKRNRVTGGWDFNLAKRGIVMGRTGEFSNVPQVGRLTIRKPEFVGAVPVVEEKPEQPEQPEAA